MGDLAAPVVVLRVTVRAPDLDAFITRYSRHIAGDRIFIFSKAPQPIGTQVRFNLQLQTGEVLIQGRGTVKRVQADVGDARHPPGMEVQFTPLDERSATLVDFMMATRAGLTEAVASASAPALVRAVVPAKPKPATPVPKLTTALPRPGSPFGKPAPSTAAKADTPPPLPVAPSGPLPVAPSGPLPAAPSGPLPAIKSKPIPVARPPSLSLESVWKSEAGEEATAVSPAPTYAALPTDAAATTDGAAASDAAATEVAAPPSALATTKSVQPSDSAQVTIPGPPPSASAAAAAMPMMNDDTSAPSLLTLATLSSLPSGPTPAPPAPDLPFPSGAGASAANADEPPSAPPGGPDLPTIVPPTVDPSVNATPVFAESWGGDAPANPFSDVSDGAIEYFVEWSLEQSIGPRALPQAQFSDVPMALPGHSGKWAAFDPISPRRRWLHVGVVFAAGALVGGVIVGLAKRAPRAATAPIAAAVAAPPTTVPAAPATEPTDPAAAPGEQDELAIVTHPAGASVRIDGDARGTTPLTTRLAAGKHEVVITKERYAAVTTSAEAPGKLALDLHRPSATLRVTSSPSAADVIIGGEHRGKTPVDVRLPGFESYDVRVALAGSKPWRKTVYLSHAQNRVDVALARPASAPRAGRR